MQLSLPPGLVVKQRTANIIRRPSGQLLTCVVLHGVGWALPQACFAYVNGAVEAPVRRRIALGVTTLLLPPR